VRQVLMLSVVFLLAWVLWEEYVSVPHGVDEWVIMDAFESKQGCEVGKDQLQAFIQQRRRERTVDAELAKRGIEQVLLCLPDTIDPRQPRR
jgi:hypothetical protein